MHSHFLSICYKQFFKPTERHVEKVGPSLAKPSYGTTQGHGD